MADYAVGTTFSFKFTTKKNGVATSLSGGTVVAYVGNSTTEITAGITLTADFDGVTGLNDVTVVATSGNGYTASDVTFVLTAGTLGGTAVYPATVGEFTFERESALRPTVAGRTIDITTTGEAGIDWANVGSPTTTLNLSGTTIKTATDDAAQLTTIAGYIDTEVATLVTNVSTILTRIGVPSSDVATIIAAIKAKTDNLPASPAATGDIPTTAQIADKVLGRNLAGSSDGGRTVKDALRTLRNKVVIDDTTVTVYQEDDTTTAWSGTATRADLDALQTVDPS